MSKAKEFSKKSGSKFFKPGSQPQLAKTEIVMALQELNKKVDTIDNDLQFVRQASRKADWRSIALLRLISAKLNIAEPEIIEKIEEVQVDAFNIDSLTEDNTKGFLNADSEVASEGLIAVIKLDALKGGNKLPGGGVLRSKIIIGQHTLVKEVDAAIVGMKVGETKRFPLDLQGATDEAEITLFQLRKFPTASQQVTEVQ